MLLRWATEFPREASTIVRVAHLGQPFERIIHRLMKQVFHFRLGPIPVTSKAESRAATGQILSEAFVDQKGEKQRIDLGHGCGLVGETYLGTLLQSGRYLPLDSFGRA